MQHVMGIVPFQCSAEQIINVLRQEHGVPERAIRVVFPDARGVGRLGFEPTRDQDGDRIIRVTRWDCQSRYNAYVLSVEVTGAVQEELVKDVFAAAGVLWITTDRQSNTPYEPAFNPPEFLTQRYAGLLHPDYRA